MKKTFAVVIFFSVLAASYFCWIALENYRIEYKFEKNMAQYTSLAEFMLEKHVVEFRRESHYSVEGKIQTLLKYTTTSGATNEQCAEFCYPKNGENIDNLLDAVGSNFVYTKHWSVPMNSIYFTLENYEKSIGFRAGGWGEVSNGQSTYGGIIDYRINDDWVILKPYDRDNNQDPGEYDL